MATKEISTETKIFDAANDIFLLYGFHGTTMHKIADKAKVNQAALHYYFRSKKKLYFKVVHRILENIRVAEFKTILTQELKEKERWFLTTELYNNRVLFDQALIELYPEDWSKKLDYINKWLNLH